MGSDGEYSQQQGSVVLFDKYDNVGDEAPGITLPGHIEKWMKEVGYAEVINKAQVLGYQNERAKTVLQEAVDKNTAGYKVFLLILAELLQTLQRLETIQKDAKGKSSKAKSLGTFANHWVMLEQGIVTTTTAKLRVFHGAA
ncbi:MAG: hypothetical protein IPM54_06355 [Polyangiaceae bacterium]|nr:hypothetical protein [Polyangiaceae bacterium]